MNDKEFLRKQYISIRNSIKDREEKSTIITKRLLQEEVYKKAKVVALYKSLPTEVNTNDLIKYSILDGKTVVLPKVAHNDLEFYKINLNEKLFKSKFGVEEPEGIKTEAVAKSEIDLVVVPGICFDKNNNRLGFGKGYYDRFLANTNLYTIGLCFDAQITDNIPAEINDIKMCKIITESLVF